MVTLIKKDQSTAKLRRIPVYLVDNTDGKEPELGVTSPTISLSKNGDATASGAGSFAEIGTGRYYYEPTAAEVDEGGWLYGNVVKSAVSRNFAFVAFIDDGTLDRRTILQ